MRKSLWIVKIMKYTLAAVLLAMALVCSAKGRYNRPSHLHSEHHLGLRVRQNIHRLLHL